ncbi:XRE family transcriptional regulator [Qipengyuania sp.]|uniref:XRE family transcriptional regulator n=1 Tax=Qipengyuania sp. TaxID=2004515 RepID=UPI003513ECDF
MDELGIDQSELARRVGCSSAAINQIVRGHTRNSRLLPKIASRLGVPLEYLTGEAGNSDFVDGLPVRSDMVAVEMVDLAYGMGGTFLDEDAESRIEEFPLSFLRQFTKSDPGQLLIAEGIGDSMTPTIGPNDLILIDRGQNMLNINDRIWACAVGEIGMIKRLRVRGDTVTILSDNENVSDDHAADGELHIVGRVVGKFSRL